MGSNLCTQWIEDDLKPMNVLLNHAEAHTSHDSCKPKQACCRARTHLRDGAEFEAGSRGNESAARVHGQHGSVRLRHTTNRAEHLYIAGEELGRQVSRVRCWEGHGDRRRRVEAGQV